MDVVAIVGSLCGVVISVWSVYSLIKKSIIGVVKSEIASLRSDLSQHREDIDVSLEERQIIFGGVQAILRHMVDDGVNGRVKASLDALESFAVQQSHRRQVGGD